MSISSKSSEKIVQTAGRKALGDFAPEFAHFNDDVLFGENWNNGKIDTKTRCIVTVVALMAQGITDSSLKYHLENARKNGVSKDEISAIITHVAFYAGWPKAWAVFNMAKDVWASEMSKEEFEKVDKFGIGLPNDGFAKYFTGKSYLKPLSDVKGGETAIFNVTFEPGCRNNWHIHHASKGGGQVLICTAGSGWYQEWGKEAVSLEEGSVVVIPANTKHWHGAKKDSWFSHITYEPAGEDTSNEWLERVSDEEYGKLGK